MEIYPTSEQRFSPFEFYSHMRKNNPIVFDEENERWGVYRYSDIEKILRDDSRFSSKFGPLDLPLGIPPEYEKNIHRPSLINSDPPYHRKLRSIVDTLFVPIEISRLAPRIENIVNELIDKIIEKNNTTSSAMDLISDFAYPLPATVIAELLGVPFEDRDTYHQWADVIVGLEENSNIDYIKKVSKSFDEMDIYFSKLIEERRKKGKNSSSTNNDDDDDTLISRIIRAKVDGHSLSEREILTFSHLLLNAGHITTVNLIGNSIFSLLENPQEFKRLQDNKNSLIKPAIEETLRYRSPVQLVIRIANDDVTLSAEGEGKGKIEREGGGRKEIEKQEIKKGQKIILFLGSANHDESVFTDPERFDITRKNLRHMAFGTGIHFCLGAPLARLEGQIALRILLERFDNLQFDFDYSDRQDLYTKVTPLKSSLFLGLSHLPIRFQTKNRQ
ncbi:MAG TPA: cytochrome P450 [Nitrososphaeraceae archaeon]|nr:cytochrome P450 [Nitrososphaeraceae archaeon]